MPTPLPQRLEKVDETPFEDQKLGMETAAFNDHTYSVCGELFVSEDVSSYGIRLLPS